MCRPVALTNRHRSAHRRSRHQRSPRSIVQLRLQHPDDLPRLTLKEQRVADELVVAQADATAQATVAVRIFTGIPSNPPGTGGWLPGNSFVAFAADAVFNDTPINADGANVAVVPLPGTSQRGIAVAPVTGAPVVRVFTAAGDPVYDPP